MIKRSCKRCGEFFEPRHGQQRYCSKACQIKYNNERRVLVQKQERAMRQPIEITCEQCGTTFETMHKNTKYCSIKCRRRVEAQAKEERKPLHPINCQWCGTEFQPLSKIQKFCCKKCRIKAKINNEKVGPPPTKKIDQKWLRRWGESDDVYKHVRRSNYGTAGMIAC